MVLSPLFVFLLVAPSCPPSEPKPACDGALPVYAAGCAARWVCPDQVEAQGLTQIDLSDRWLPTTLREAPELGDAGKQPYRATYLKLAAGQVEDREVERRARVDRYLEPYGIFPNLTVVRDRLLEAERHRCRDAVEDSSLALVERIVSAYEPREKQRKRMKAVRSYERRFTRTLKRAHDKAQKAARKRAKKAGEAFEPTELVEPGPAEFEALGADKKWARSVRKWRKARARVDAIRAAQDHLRCEGLLTRDEDTGLYGHHTQQAMQIFQRKHMLGSRAHVDAETRATLAEDSRELDFRALLRALRERVVAATGLIEDGSALGRWGAVLGRTVDGEEFRHASHGVPLPNGAEDYISPATEATAVALGWTSPEVATERLAALSELSTLVVAVKLPPLPPWHSAHMDLRAEVDRGDVWYEYPVTEEGKRRNHPISRRPSTTLYVRHGDREIALVRWPTTIGGWKPERLETGETVYSYKNSPVGDRVWRSLVSGPSWLPPPSTPVQDLVQRDGRGGHEVKQDILGPSYASAFGLIMLIYEKQREAADGTMTYADFGIRSHGSVSYRSIIRGASHGCHRLFNHMAVRLGAFLLRHRTHTVEGLIPVRYGHDFEFEEQPMSIRISNRGFGYQLVPPVPVKVLRGRVRGRVHRAPKGSRPVP